MANADIPAWIKAQLFENVLRQTIRDFKQIREFKVFPALAPGENYATVMLKVQVDVLLTTGSTQRQSFMLKVAHDTELYRNELSKFEMFISESGMYRDIKPEFEKLYADAGLQILFGAKSYALPVDKEYILLEDLSLKGFKNAKRQDCLDMEHCKAVLKKISQFHAASAVRIEQKGMFEKPYLHGFLRDEGRNFCKNMFDTSLPHLMKTIEKLENHHDFYEQIKSLSNNNIVDIVYENCLVDESEFNVLNHGDCWANNIMFQYDGQGKLMETFLVDLQLPRYGSPAQDLLYFIISSAHINIKTQQFDCMIRYYYDNLIDHLKLLKYAKPLPTLRDIHKALIKYGIWDSSTKPISFMLKIGHDSEIFREFQKNHDVFAIEAGMYRDFVPEFEQLFTDAGVKVTFGAKAYQLPIEENYILLENLKVLGFKNTNRLEGLNREHTESVLKKLAQWHAASAVRVTEKGPYPRDFCTAYLKPEGYDLIKEMFDGMSKTLLECVKEYSNANLYYEKVAKLQSQITDEMLKFTEPDLSEFNVLNHGDCWSNNIMFKYDEQGNILETYLVDFQMPRYSSPAFDLIYFLLSSTKLEIKLKDFDYFIKFYHDQLVDSLKILNYNKSIPSLKEIHTMIYKYGVYGYLTTTNVMAAVLCDPTDNASLDNFVNNSEDGVNFKKQMYSNARYRKHMEAIFPWLLYKGLLDC